MANEEKPRSDMQVIREFFYKDENGKLAPTSVFGPEYKALSDQDKSDLAEGIRNGTLTY